MAKTKIYTLSELQNMNSAFLKRIEDTKTTISTEEARIAEIDAEMNAATEIGDIPKYKKLFAERSDLVLDVEALRSVVEKSAKMCSRGFTYDDVLAAFENYISDFNSRVPEYKSKIEDAVKAVNEIYIKAAEDQNAQLVEKEKYEELIANDGEMFSHKLKLNSQMKRIPTTDQVFSGGFLSQFDHDTAAWLNMVCDVASSYVKPKGEAEE